VRRADTLLHSIFCDLEYPLQVFRSSLGSSTAPPNSFERLFAGCLGYPPRLFSFFQLFFSRTLSATLVALGQPSLSSLPMHSLSATLRFCPSVEFTIWSSSPVFSLNAFPFSHARFGRPFELALGLSGWGSNPNFALAVLRFRSFFFSR